MSGFFDWVRGPHPVWRKIGWLVLFAGILYLSWTYLSVVIGILFILSFIIGHFMFRNSWWEEDGVRVLRFYEDQPSLIDWQYMGKTKFEEYPKLGDARAAKRTSAGQPVYVVEKEIEGVLVFAQIQELSHLEYVSDVHAMDFAREVAEEAIMENNQIARIPKILGTEYAKEPIRSVLHNRISQTVSLTPGDKGVQAFIDDMKDKQSPYQRLRAKYLKKEKEAKDARMNRLIEEMNEYQEDPNEGEQAEPPVE